MRFVAILALFALSAPAFAQDAPPSPKPEPVKERKVCRVIEVTGSMMGKRECHTPTEWRQIQNANSDAAGRALNSRREPDGIVRN
jgi:hypothetical protein